MKGQWSSFGFLFSFSQSWSSFSFYELFKLSQGLFGRLFHKSPPPLSAPMLPLIHCQDYDYRGKRAVSLQGTATALPVCLWLFHWAIFIYDLNFKESFNEEGFLAHCSSWAWRTKGRRGGFQNGCHRYFIRSTFAGAHKAQRSTDMLPGPAKIKDNSVFLFVSCFFFSPFVFAIQSWIFEIGTRTMTVTLWGET